MYRGIGESGCQPEVLGLQFLDDWQPKPYGCWQPHRFSFACSYHEVWWTKVWQMFVMHMCSSSDHSYLDNLAMWRVLSNKRELGTRRHAWSHEGASIICIKAWVSIRIWVQETWGLEHPLIYGPYVWTQDWTQATTLKTNFSNDEYFLGRGRLRFDGKVMPH